MFCTAKYRGGVRRTEGLKKQRQQQTGYHTLPCRVPWHYGVSQNSMEKKAALQSSSPVFCNAKDRGGVRSAEGLENIGSNKSGITLSPAVPRSIAGPQGEGVKPYNQKLLWNLTTISLKEEKYIQEPFANDRPYST